MKGKKPEKTQETTKICTCGGIVLSDQRMIEAAKIVEKFPVNKDMFPRLAAPVWKTCS